MRHQSELLLVIFLIQAPMLLLFFGWLSGPIAEFWLPVCILVSLLSGLGGFFYLHSQFVKPFRQLVDKLYGRECEPSFKSRHQDMEQIERAIRFYATHQNRHHAEEIQNLKDRLDEQRHLYNQEHDADEIVNIAARYEQQIDADEHRGAIRALTDRALRRFTTELNRFATKTSVPADLFEAANQLRFLQGKPTVGSRVGSFNLLDLIDQSLTTLAPLLRQSRCNINVRFNTGCTTMFDIDADRFKQTFFGLVLDHLKTNTAGSVSAIIDHQGDQLSISFSHPFAPRITMALDEILVLNQASWRAGTLIIPARPSNKLTPAADRGLTALLVTDNDSERMSLAQRLQLLGVSCTNDFKFEQLDLCLVADETSDEFLAIRPYLPHDAYVLLLNNTVHYRHPYWLQLDDPVSQNQLEKIIDEIENNKHKSSKMKVSKMKVLAVDDSEANLILLEMQLTELNLEVSLARSAAEALDLIAAQTFDLIFMDIQMPELDGVLATKKIRDLGHKIPIVGLTAHATREEQDIYYKAGMSEVLIKPVRINKLKSMIRQMGSGSAKPPIQAPAQQSIPLFDLELSLKNANQRPDLAAELMAVLISGLPDDLSAILKARENLDAQKRAVHKLHGAVRYCGVPRLGSAIEKLESAIKQGDEQQLPLLLNLLGGEITALIAWYSDNPDILTQGHQATNQ